ncbi:MAG: AIPR family protein [Candidatus Binataceae bacterium]
MDLITKSLLDEFSREHEITSLAEDKRFEHFASYITVRRQYSETFDSEEVVTGAGGDTGIDGIAIIVNGTLITDVESIAEFTGTLDVAFVFVQAARTSSFDGAKIGNFAYGVRTFFEASSAAIQNTRIQEAVAIKNAIYERSSKFKRGNPACYLYYVTTGTWTNDPNLESRRTTAIADLKATQLFSDVKFFPIGAIDIQKLYRQAKNAITRNFTFLNKSVLPQVQSVEQAYLGFLPARELLKLLTDDEGDLIESLFYDNVRGWQGLNEVNSEISDTIRSDFKDRFVLMNNGITIIARSLQPTGNSFAVEDFQVVNGCQTCHVLFDQKDGVDESVMIPLRLIATQDEGVTHSIIRATNRQTEVKEEQFFAMTEFAKRLEEFFGTFPNGRKLFYERRSRQYDSLSIEKTRLVTPANMIRAFAAMFLEEPHRTTRNYSSLREKVGKEIFVEGHRLEPYYVSAWALYKLEYLFRSGRLDAKYKPARFHLLLAVRLLFNSGSLPQMNSKEMTVFCNALSEVLWDSARADAIFAKAVGAVDVATRGDFNRDIIRSQPTTERLKDQCRTA